MYSSYKFTIFFQNPKSYLKTDYTNTRHVCTINGPKSNMLGKFYFSLLKSGYLNLTSALHTKRAEASKLQLANV